MAEKRYEVGRTPAGTTREQANRTLKRIAAACKRAKGGQLAHLEQDSVEGWVVVVTAPVREKDED